MHPQPLFEIFGQSVYLYGVLIGVGILACFGVFYLYTSKKKMSTEVQDFIFFVGVISIAVGFGFAALYQAVYSWLSGDGFKFNGITAMGGFIGGAGAFLLLYFVAGKYIFTGKRVGLHKREFNKVFLVAPCCITVAHAFGRLGCLMAGCCYGKKSTTGFTLYIHGAERIPVQLYEAIFLFILFAVLSVMYFKRYNITMAVYLIAYGIWRFIIEYFRGDDSARKFFLGLFPSQWQSVAFILGGVFLIVFYIVKKIPLRLPKEEPKEKLQEEPKVSEKENI